MEYANKHHIRWTIFSIDVDIEDPSSISLKARDMELGEEYSGELYKVVDEICDIMNNELDN